MKHKKKLLSIISAVLFSLISLDSEAANQANINLRNHPYIMSKFYEHIRPALNLNSNLILVNKNYVLDKDYVPENLVFMKDLNLLVDDNERYYIKKEAYQALKALLKEAEKQNFLYYISSGYRSYRKQEKIYEQYKIIYENADLFSARPGHSEHQTGLAVDITCKAADYLLTERFASTKEGLFIKHNAYKYGFIERYPKNKEHLTGYNYEPWHLRYVGTKASVIIYHNNLTLEEYLIYYTVMPK